MAATFVLLAALFAFPSTVLAALWLGIRKQWKACTVVALLALGTAQVSLLPYALGLDELFPGLDYESSDGGFKGSECFKSTDCSWNQLVLDFADYRRSRSDRSIELVRTFKAEPWKFWRWHEYMTATRWQLRFQPARCQPEETSCVAPVEHHRPVVSSAAEYHRQQKELAQWVQDLL